MAIPISNVTRRIVYEADGTGPYSFTFEILAQTDIAVFEDDTLLTLTTDYSVTINANGTGSVTLVSSPTGDQIAIVGNRTIARSTDFTTGGDFFANTLNDELDQQTIFAQQNAEGLNRALQAPQTDPTSIDMTLPRASDRAGKFLAFDVDGNPVPGAVPDELQEVLDIEAELVAVAAITTEIVAVEAVIGNIETLAPIASDISDVANISSEVSTVAGLSAAIATVNANEGNIDIVAGLNTEISALGPIAASIQAVGNLDAADLQAVGNIESEVVIVSGIAGNIETLAPIAADITTAAGISASITTVAGISNDVTSVADISVAVSAVNSNETNINIVATDLTGNNDIGAAAAVAEDIGIVAGLATEIAAVDANETNINTVAADLAGSNTIGTVATNIANVNTVAGISTAVSAVGNIDAVDLAAVGNIEDEVIALAAIAGNIETVAGISSDVTTVATNVADITNFSDVYLGPAASDPATRNDSSALQAGDLYFNTNDDVIKVYTGSAWTVSYVPADGFLVAANNLSELTNTTTARQNLGVEIGVDVQAYDSTIVVDADIGVTVQAYDANLTAFLGNIDLPTSDGTTGQVLQTNGSGTLSFATPSTGVTTGKAIAMAIVFG